MKLTRAISALLLALVSSGLCVAQNSVVHNGYWWNKTGDSMRLGYVIGFVEGAGQADTYWTVASSNSKAKIADLKVVEDTLDFRQTRFGQFEEGLDEFYKDFRNMSIHVGDALLHVRDEIKGTSKEFLEADIERLRKAAGQPSYDH